MSVTTTADAGHGVNASASWRDSWSPLHDRFYRQHHLYEMQWDEADLKTSRVTVAIAHHGGNPIAVLMHQQPSPVLRIYTASGQLLSSTPWLHSSPLVSCHWSSLEQLVCVLQDAEVVTYSMHGEPLASFSLPSNSACRREGVAEVVQWNDGFVARSKQSSELYLVASLREPRPTLMPSISLGGDGNSQIAGFTCMAVVGGGRRGADIEVLVATQDGSLLLVDKSGCQDLLLSSGPFLCMKVSPCGLLLACFSSTGTLHIYSTDLSSNVCTFATSSKVPPTSMAWCGSSAILLHWPGILLLVGMYGNYIKFNSSSHDPLLGSHSSSSGSSSSACILLQEQDCVRVISKTSHSIIQIVHESLQSVFEKGSSHPAAKLFAASEAFEAKDAQAAELIREIQAQDRETTLPVDPVQPAAAKSASTSSTATSSAKPGSLLRDAVSTCLLAAAHEFMPHLQQSLLKAASYGQLFAAPHEGTASASSSGSSSSCASSSQEFVNVCNVLRLCNNLRHPNVGIGLTYAQYLSNTVDTLVQRLTQRRHYLLAIRLCEAFKLEADRVVVHWACTKISHADGFSDEAEASASPRMTDQQLADLLLHQLQSFPQVSYIPIASTAYRYGRRALALQLIDFESLASDQVPFLLSMKEDEIALDKACASGDTDLILISLTHSLNNRPPAFVFSLIKERPFACAVFIQYARSSDLTLLKQWYLFSNLYSQAATVIIRQAYGSANLNERLNLLLLAQELFDKDKSSAFQSRACAEQIKLLQLQRDHELNNPATNPLNSVVDTPLISFLSQQYRTALTDKDKKKVLKLAGSYKVNDARYLFMQVRLLSQEQLWDDLYALAMESGGSSKRGPIIGWSPFIEACIEAQNLTEARRFIERLPDHREAIEWLCNIGEKVQAAQIAAKHRDAEALKVIRASSRDRQLTAEIDELVASISQR